MRVNGKTIVKDVDAISPGMGVSVAENHALLDMVEKKMQSLEKEVGDLKRENAILRKALKPVIGCRFTTDPDSGCMITDWKFDAVVACKAVREAKKIYKKEEK